MLTGWHQETYVRFVMDEFGVLLEANPPFALQANEESQDKAHLNTRKLWQALYPKEPFFLSSERKNHDESVVVPKLLAGFDVLASTKRQATFLWQVSGERFEDVHFLHEAVENYYKFLTLKRKDRKALLVRT